MINKHCDLIYCNSLKQSKANAKLYLLINNYFKFLFQIQKYFLDLFKNNFAILNNNVASAHCVNNSEAARKGFPERGAERKPLVISVNNSDNLSGKIKNLCSVIKNKLLSEVQPWTTKNF